MSYKGRFEVSIFYMVTKSPKKCPNKPFMSEYSHDAWNTISWNFSIPALNHTFSVAHLYLKWNRNKGKKGGIYGMIDYKKLFPPKRLMSLNVTTWYSSSFY